MSLWQQRRKKWRSYLFWVTSPWKLTNNSLWAAEWTQNVVAATNANSNKMWHSWIPPSLSFQPQKERPSTITSQKGKKNPKKIYKRKKSPVTLTLSLYLTIPTKGVQLNLQCVSGAVGLNTRIGCPKCRVKWCNSGAVVLWKYKGAVWIMVLVFDVTQRKNCEKHWLIWVSNL